MEPEVGRVYECKPADLAMIPMDVQIRMFQGGRLRSVRYDGPAGWHVLDDGEMVLEAEAELRRAEAKLVTEDEPRALVRLDLGCGNNPREGFEGVDLFSEGAKHKVDLFRFPWPWADESVDELHSSHFLEHVPAEFVRVENAPGEEGKRYVGQDYLFAVMDECWRILRPGGTIQIIVPNSRSDGAFQDPTHRRFWNEHTFPYFHEKGRAQLGVPHYRTVTNFDIVQLTPVGPIEIGLMHPEVQANKWRKEWNSVLEWHGKLRKPG